MKKIDIYKLITAILQLAGGLTLVGISVYYHFAENTVNFWLFLAIGVVFTVWSVYSLIKLFKKNGEDGDGGSQAPPKGFL